MSSNLYFCLFCDNVFTSEASLQQHMSGKHCMSDPKTSVWIKSMVKYETQLNECLQSQPKRLPKSVVESLSQKLLIGCGLCDQIINYFKLTLNSDDITNDFEISELKRLSISFQRIHVFNHYKYYPFVCKVWKDEENVICDEKHINQNFFKTHLKFEHNVNCNENDLSKYCSLNEISKVQQLIDRSLSDICGQPVVQSQQISNSTGSKTSINVKNIKIKTRNDISVQSSGPPILTPILTFDSQSNSNKQRVIDSNGSKFMSSSDRPPVLTKQSSADTSSSTKRGRGRPKGSLSKKKTNSFGSNNYLSNTRNLIEENPFKGKRLSEKPRLSRPNISLSREQEKDLKKKKSNYNDSDDSEWDESIEQFEMSGTSHTNRVSLNNRMSSTDSRHGSSESTVSHQTGPKRKRLTDMSEENVIERENTNRNRFSTQVMRVEDSESDDNPISDGDNSKDRRPVANTSGTKDIFSDWLMQTKSKKYPYFPQIGDEVVYIPYGHRLYMKAVREHQLYLQTNNNKYVNSNDIFYAKVKEIKFEKQSNVRFAKLTLKLVEPNADPNNKFTVRFHDINNVLDFIILRQTYESSRMNNWKVGDHFMAIVEDRWWFGTIGAVNTNKFNIKDPFQALEIVWANHMKETMSFWDIEKVRGVLPHNRRSSLEVTDEDRDNFYRSDPNEWPACGKAKECKRIAEGLNQIMLLKECEELMEEFNASNKQYVDRIAYPINLETILSRVRNHFYRRHSAVKYDIKFLESNAVSMDSDEDSDVVTNARIVVTVCLKFIDGHKESVDKIYTKVINEKKTLNKIKYYSCTRIHLNPSSKVSDSSVVNYEEVFRSMPSTSQTDNQTIDDTNHSDDISIITIDSEVFEVEENIQVKEEPNEEQEMEQSLPQTPNNISNTSKFPTKSVNRLSERSSHFIAQKRFFCIFCVEKFSEKAEAIDHYCNNHLKVKLPVCPHCPQNTKWQSLDDFNNHNDQHIHKIDNTFNWKSYSIQKSWIESIVDYNESIRSVEMALKEVDIHFGDCCPVCQRLNNCLTKDSKPLFHSMVFVNNRQKMDNSIRIEEKFKKHLNQHLKYNPNYKCILCSSDGNVFTSDTFDVKLFGRHLMKEHKVFVKQESDVKNFINDSNIDFIGNQFRLIYYKSIPQLIDY